MKRAVGKSSGTGKVIHTFTTITDCRECVREARSFKSEAQDESVGFLVFS